MAMPTKLVDQNIMPWSKLSPKAPFANYQLLSRWGLKAI
ncbi:hypothetical protein CCACVL1_19564 [Corchorus capsularis]|uniref:Uncharacterized protein n=1 Tax=Corchorus capsularis TaxID=210143 RepID=A0A1R3HFZ9_COCAP|nr:hypothetical protein CCACVL1_19564 [Corchorus capsularis]